MGIWAPFGGAVERTLYEVGVRPTTMKGASWLPPDAALFGSRVASGPTI